jgi:hypothetical protein
VWSVAGSASSHWSHSDDWLTPPDPAPYDLSVPSPRHAVLELARRPWVQALGFYLGLALLATFPLCLFPFTRVPGEHFDVWGTLWVGDWFQRALLVEHVSPLFCPDVGYPFGLSQNLIDSWIWAAAAVPLVTLLGPTLALNVFVLASLVFSGISLYLLARDRGASHGASLLTGSLYVSSAIGYALFAEGAVYLLMAGWLPLCAMYLLRVFDGRFRAGWGVALCFAGACYTSGYTGISAAVICLSLTALHPLPWWRGPHRRALVRMAPLAILLVLPLVAANLSALRGDAVSADPFDKDQQGRIDRERADWLPNVPRDSATVASLFVPPALARSAEPSPRDRTSYLGLLPLLLAALGLWSRGGGRWLIWAGLFGVSLLLLLGPVLLWSSIPHGAAPPAGPVLPMELVYDRIPGAELLRFPYRFLYVALLALAVPLSRGLDMVLGRMRRAWRWGLVALFLAEVLLVSGGPPLKPTQSAAPSAAYQAIADAPGAGAILEIGNVGQRWKDRRLAAQIVHRRPITAEFPMFDDLSTTNLFHTLLSQRMEYELSGGRNGVEPAVMVDVLRTLGFAYVVHDHHSVEADRAIEAHARAEWLIGAATVLTADLGAGQTYPPGLTVYTVPGADSATPRLLAAPSEGQINRMSMGRVVEVLGELVAGRETDGS